ncbi:MAG: exodeoxyribonuclease VII small subunit [Pseudomonadota bacterium]|nr:exodeoxyribonuclease VII small subunit [Pseudomonadota bacterium]
MADELKTDDIAKMSFEEALAELETIVGALEGGKGELEEAISAYERGALLKSHCEKKLKAAQTKVEKISLTAGGEVTARPVEIE